MKLLLLLKRLTGSGLIKPLPGSGIAEEVSQAVIEVKTQNNYKRLIQLAVYIVMCTGCWYLLAKGIATVDEIRVVFELVSEAIKFIM